jgi:hypothetical protein
MLIASAISLRSDICGLRSIGVQRKLPWQRTSDDEHSALCSTGVLPTNGWTGSSPMGWPGHRLPAEWTGHIKCRYTTSLPAEWTGHIKCRGSTSPVRRRVLPAINAEDVWPRSLTSGSARWITSRAVGHAAASGLRLSGERTRPGPDTSRLRTPA